MRSSTGLADLQLADLRADRLRCHSSLVGGVLTLRFSGAGQAADHALLTRLLDNAHQVAIAHRATKVVADLLTLRFMNASCFRAFASWLTQVGAMPPHQRYSVHFRLDRSGNWQRLSVGALAQGRTGRFSVE